MRPDLHGGMMVPVVVFVIATQAVSSLEEQVPAEVRFMTFVLSMSLDSWRVGLMTSLPFSMKTFSSSSVVWSNCPFLWSVSACFAFRELRQLTHNHQPPPP